MVECDVDWDDGRMGVVIQNEVNWDGGREGPLVTQSLVDEEREWLERDVPIFLV